jgi:hypothetical protein
MLAMMFMLTHEASLQEGDTRRGQRSEAQAPPTLGRVYVGHYRLWLTLESGLFEAMEIDVKDKTVRLGFSGADPHTRTARLRIEQPA